MSVSSDSALSDRAPGPGEASAPRGRGLPAPGTTRHPTPGVPRIESTDGELISLFARHDDRDALDRLIDRHASMVWRVCRQALRRPQDAEDAFQATFLLLIKNAKSIQSSDSAAGWLYRVAYRTSIRARKQLAARREESLAVDPDAPSEKAFPDLLRKQTTGVLVEELMRLPAKYQTPLVLRYLEGQSRRAIADQTDTTIAAVQGQLARGKQLLRRRLLRRGVSLSAAMAALGLAGRGAQAAETAPAHVVAQTTSNGVALASGGSLAASAAVVSLYQEGVRAMLLIWIAKPAGVAASIAAVALLAMVPGAEGDKQTTTPSATLQLAVDLPSEREASTPGVESTERVTLAQANTSRDKARYAETHYVAELIEAMRVLKPESSEKQLLSSLANRLRQEVLDDNDEVGIFAANQSLVISGNGDKQKKVAKLLGEVRDAGSDLALVAKRKDGSTSDSWVPGDADSIVRIQEHLQRLDRMRQEVEAVQAEYGSWIEFPSKPVEERLRKILKAQGAAARRMAELHAPDELLDALLLDLDNSEKLTGDGGIPPSGSPRETGTLRPGAFLPPLASEPTPRDRNVLTRWPTGQYRAEREYRNGRLVAAIEYAEDGTVLKGYEDKAKSLAPTLQAPTVTAQPGATGVVRMTAPYGGGLTATTTPQPDGSAELRVQTTEAMPKAEPLGISLRLPVPDGPRVKYAQRNSEYGWSVNQLQERLNELLEPSPGLRSDGDYGPLTTRAVKRFQKLKGLPDTGLADQATRAALGFVLQGKAVPTVGGNAPRSSSGSEEANRYSGAYTAGATTPPIASSQPQTSPQYLLDALVNDAAGPKLDRVTAQRLIEETGAQQLRLSEGQSQQAARIFSTLRQNTALQPDMKGFQRDTTLFRTAAGGAWSSGAIKPSRPRTKPLDPRVLISAMERGVERMLERAEEALAADDKKAHSDAMEIVRRSEDELKRKIDELGGPDSLGSPLRGRTLPSAEESVIEILTASLAESRRQLAADEAAGETSKAKRGKRYIELVEERLDAIKTASGSERAKPTVIQTVPPRGATEVDPNLQEIRVTFDRDMDLGGYSFTGNAESGLPDVPKDAKPSWIDKRTCVLLVKLKSGREYRVGINAPSHKNFKSADGAPAAIDELRFSTAASTHQYGSDSKMKQGQWNCLHRPTELNPNGWATVAELKVGEYAPIKLPDDARPRPHLKLESVEGEWARFVIVDPGFPEDGETWDTSEPRTIRGVPVETVLIGDGDREGSRLLVVRRPITDQDRNQPASTPSREVAKKWLNENQRKQTQASRRRESSEEPTTDAPPTAVEGSPTVVAGDESQPVAKRSATRVDHTDNKADGKKSLGGSGHLIRFELPEGVAGVKAVRLHGSRYGAKAAPREDFEISFLSEDRSEVLAVERAAYGLFRRGAEKWTTVRFKAPVVDLPETFWIAIDFAPGRTKGVYLSYDSSTDGSRSMTGLVQQEPGEHQAATFGGDWMVSLVLERAAAATKPSDLAEVKAVMRKVGVEISLSDAQYERLVEAWNSPEIADQRDSHRMARAIRRVMVASTDDAKTEELNALNAQAWRHFFSNEQPRAEKLFRQILEADADHLAACNGMGFCLINRGEHKQALPLFEKCVAANPEAPGPLNGLGRTLEAAGDVDGAIAAWERGVAAMPNQLGAAHMALARVYSEQKQWEKALPLLEQIVADQPEAEPYAEWLRAAKRAANPAPPKPLTGDGVYVVGTYSGADGEPLVVEVPATEEPITLLLCAYYWQDWKLQLDPAAKLERVVVAGYNGQRLDGVIDALPEGVPLDVFSYFETKRARNDTPRPESFGDREYFYAYKKTSEEYYDLVDKVRQLTGKEIAHFQGATRADSFVVGRD